MGLALAGIALTMTTDYRLLVFARSARERQLAAWTTERGSPVVGDSGPGAQDARSGIGDSDDVRLLTEVPVPNRSPPRRGTSPRSFDTQVAR